LMTISMPSTIGFVGLGAMGAPMARTLRKNLSSSAVVYIYDISKDAMNGFAGVEGMAATLSARDLCEKSECIITIVPEGKDVSKLFLEGLLLVDNVEGKIFIDCSTIDMGTSAEFAQKVRDKGSAYYDCPVSGGTMGAEQGTLTFMMGIEEQDPNYPLVRAVCGMMGTNLFPCGGPTLGLASKLTNNYVSGLIAIATSEGMNLGMRLGLDPKVLSAVFSTSTAQSWVNDKCNPVPGLVLDSPPSKGYKPGFKVQLMRKDFALAVESAQRVGAKLVLGDAGLATYTAAAEDPRCRDLDSRVVYRWLGGQENELENEKKRSE